MSKVKVSVKKVVWSPKYCSLLWVAELTAMSEFWSEAVKMQFVRMRSTKWSKTAQNDWRHVVQFAMPRICNRAYFKI